MPEEALLLHHLKYTLHFRRSFKYRSPDSAYAHMGPFPLMSIPISKRSQLAYWLYPNSYLTISINSTRRWTALTCSLTDQDSQKANQSCDTPHSCEGWQRQSKHKIQLDNTNTHYYFPHKIKWDHVVYKLIAPVFKSLLLKIYQFF